MISEAETKIVEKKGQTPPNREERDRSVKIVILISTGIILVNSLLFSTYPLKKQCTAYSSTWLHPFRVSCLVLVSTGPSPCPSLDISAIHCHCATSFFVRPCPIPQLSVTINCLERKHTNESNSSKHDEKSRLLFRYVLVFNTSTSRSSAVVLTVQQIE